MSHPTPRAAMRWSIAAVFLLAGIGHLVTPDKFLSVTPDWVPFAPTVIFITGLCEMAGAAALLTTRLRYAAGIALALYTLLVWPANFKHAFDALDGTGLPMSWFYHGPRLAFQPVIIWWCLYCAGVIDWPFRAKART